MAAAIEGLTERYFSTLLDTAGIKINGPRPWDIQVNNSRFFPRVFTGGSLALGESYMDEWWDCEALDILFYKLLRRKIDNKFRFRFSTIAKTIESIIQNRQNKNRAYEVGEQHYDAGNDLFRHMLDSRMVYSCGYWRDAQELSQAQLAKMEMICRKLRLAPGMRLLDIGCGWGSLIEYAARRHGISAVGLTISRKQAQLAKKRCEGLPVEIMLEDYREACGNYDAVVSVGMFEHVGYKNYDAFMKVVHRCLKDEGLFLLHTIASNETVRNCDPWFDKYIFPNGMLPSIQQLGTSIEKYFIMEDWQNLGAHYDQTLQSWYRNFDSNWEKLRSRYSRSFYRMWRYYLLSLAGAFRARKLQVWQIVFSPGGITGGYNSIRCKNCADF